LKVPFLGIIRLGVIIRLCELVGLTAEKLVGWERIADVKKRKENDNNFNDRKKKEKKKERKKKKT
jgi:hypothetical protein